MVPAAPGNGTTRRPVRPGVTPARPSPLSLLAVGRSAAILTGGTIVAQLLGFAREFYLAATIGVSSGLDAFLIALVVPMTLAGAITTGTTRALVPVYIEAADSRDAQRFAGIVMLWAGAAGLATWIVLVTFADLTVTIAGPGLSVTAHDEAVGFLHTLAPLAFVMADYGDPVRRLPGRGPIWRNRGVDDRRACRHARHDARPVGGPGPWCTRARQSRGPDRWPPGAPSIDDSRFDCPDPDPAPRSASRALPSPRCADNPGNRHPSTQCRRRPRDRVAPRPWRGQHPPIRRSSCANADLSDRAGLGLGHLPCPGPRRCGGRQHEPGECCRANAPLCHRCLRAGSGVDRSRRSSGDVDRVRARCLRPRAGTV